MHKRIYKFYTPFKCIDAEETRSGAHAQAKQALVQPAALNEVWERRFHELQHVGWRNLPHLEHC